MQRKTRLEPPAGPPAQTTGAILSVSEFTQTIKSHLEGHIPATWIRGEVSNLRKQASGHSYFTLKDAGSQLACVLFRGNALGMSLALKDGLQVLIYGDLSVYEPRGNYQIIVRLAMDDGQGKLQVAFEQLKSKLGAEGLFDPKRKQPLPALPRTVGIITSPTGAAIQDFISILKRREWTGHLIILPALVQGQEAAADLCQQLRRAQALDEPKLELLVLARGGGSLEDLWCFNDEALARELARCAIPTLSAVGHETDFTLCDFVADRRAETPSAAAEILTQPYLENLQLLEALRKRLTILSPKNRLEQGAQRLDDLTNWLNSILQTRLLTAKTALGELNARIQALSPQRVIGVYRERMAQLQKRLAATSIEAQLRRGFSIVKNANGKLLRSKKDVHAQEPLLVTFIDGSANVLGQ